MKRLAFVLISCLAVVGCGGDDDASAPSVAIDSGPDSLTNQTHVSVAFHAVATATSGSAAGFACVIDTAAPAMCTSPFAFDVTDGAHTFEVAAVGDNGSAGMPAEVSWTTDTTPPDTAISNAPTGVVMTTTAMLTFVAQPADPAATFQCAFDTTTFTACTSPTSVTGSDGDHTFAVRATDAAGNTDPTPAMASWTISTVGPELMFTEKPTDPSNNKTPAFGFSSSDTSATFECQVDGLTTFAACGSPFTTPSLADGAQTFEVRATDAAHNQTTISYTWTVDATAPAITFTGGPTGPTNVVTPTFTFTVTGAPTDIECESDTAGFAPCTSPATTSTLGQGAHTFTVKATDAAGNSATATQSFSIDTISPTVAITSGPSGPTNNPLPTWAFTTTGSPTTITCVLDSATATACTSPFAVTTNLADGSHTFTVTVTDLAGNTGTDSRTITIDTVAPVVTITSGPTGTITNVTPTFTFTVTGGATATSCRMDTGAFAPCSATFTSPPLGGGAHTFEVQATDAAGNLGDATQSFTVDSSAPTITITSAPPGITNDSTPTFMFVAGAVAATVQCQVDGEALAACTSPSTVAPALAEGSHTFTVQACTAAAACASDSRTFTVDLTPPVVIVTAGPQDPVEIGVSVPTFAFTATDATSSVASLTCRITDSANPNPAFVTCSGTFTPSNQLTDGSHTFEVKAVDGAGNTTDVTRTFTIDSTPPAIVIGPPLIATRTSLTQPKVFFLLFDASVVTAQCAIDSGAAAACDGTAGFASATPLAEGAHVYHVIATDAAGNQASASVPFTVDTTPPTVTVNSGPANPTNDTGPTFTFTVGADAVVVTCKMDTGETISPCTSPAKFPSALTPGARTFTVTASDNAVPANSASATYAFFLGSCGDGSAQGTEVCDGNDLRGNSCTTLGSGFTQGTLQCSGSCVFNTAECSTCGDGVIGSGEVCDGSNIGSGNCGGLGGGFTSDDGTPGCNGTCTSFTTSTCGTCGNGVIDGDEQCDPGDGSALAADFGSNTCVTLGHAPGNLACNADCTLGSAAELAGSGFCDGGFLAANVGSDDLPFSGTVCPNGLATSAASTVVEVCTEENGVWRGLLTEAASPPAGTFPIATISPTWSKADGSGAGSADGTPAIEPTVPAFPLVGATEVGNVATFTTSDSLALVPGQAALITGVTPAGYNGEFFVLASPAPTATTFSVTLSASGLAPASGGSVAAALSIASASNSGTPGTANYVASFTTNASLSNSFTTGQAIVVANVQGLSVFQNGPGGYNNAFSVLASPAPGTNEFSVTLPSASDPSAMPASCPAGVVMGSFALILAQESGSIATFTTAQPISFVAGMPIAIGGVAVGGTVTGTGYNNYLSTARVAVPVPSPVTVLASPAPTATSFSVQLSTTGLADGVGGNVTTECVTGGSVSVAGVSSVTSDLGRRMLFGLYLTRDAGADFGLLAQGPYQAPFPPWNSFQTSNTFGTGNPPSWNLGPQLQSYSEQMFTRLGTFTGGWDPVSNQAAIRFSGANSRDCGLNPTSNSFQPADFNGVLPLASVSPPQGNNCSIKALVGAPGNGTVTSIASTATDAHATVYGKINIDESALAVGDASKNVDVSGGANGIYWSPDSGAHWVEDDSGISAADKALVFTAVADPSTFVTTQATPRTPAQPTVTAIQSVSETVAIAAIPTGAVESGTTATFTTTTAHGLAVGQAIVISGVTVSGYNGSLTVASVPTATTFTVNGLASSLPASGGGKTTGGTNATFITSIPHGMLAGQSVTIAGVGNAAYNGTFTIASVPLPPLLQGGSATALQQSTFTVSLAALAPGLPASSGGTVTDAAWANKAYALVMYVGLRGGSSIYKTINGGLTWAVSDGDGTPAHSLPAGTEVWQLAIDCASNVLGSATCPNASGVATTITSASNNVSLPQATINVTSTTGFPASGGSIVVTTASGFQTVTCTGTTATTFTGCAGGAGLMSTNKAVATLDATPLLYAATNHGLYKSKDAGATWTLAGLEGHTVRSVMLQTAHLPGTTPYILTATSLRNDVWARNIQDAP